MVCEEGQTTSPAGKRQARDLNRGFTFLELVVVTSIVAILTVWAAPPFRKVFDRWQLSLCVQEIAALSRFAQAQALVEGLPIRLEVDSESRSARLMGQTTSEAGEPTWGAIHPMRALAIPQGIHLKGDSAKVTFLPDGRATFSDETATSLELEFQHQDGQAQSLRIQGTTGRVTVPVESPPSP